MNNSTDLGSDFQLVKLLIEHDAILNDIADHEYNRTPLVMILANKEIITNPLCEERVAKTIEFFTNNGAVFDADEREKQKIRKNLQGFSEKGAVNGIMQSNSIEDCSLTPSHESIGRLNNEQNISHKPPKTIMEDETHARHNQGCWFYSSCK